MAKNLPEDFLSFSAELGADPLLVQGPGGNTSVKSDGSMHIKASGTELIDSRERDIFVEVDLEAARAEIDGDGDGSCVDALKETTRGLRPSIETTFHALLPQRFVFHYHSVNSICYSATKQGRKLLSQKLHGLNWLSIPYRKPGLNLTLEVREALTLKIAEVFILENHGVIVGAETVQRAIDLVGLVENRLALDKNIEEIVKPEVFASLPKGWEMANSSKARALDSVILRRACLGSYYPDHVVFLGPSLPHIEENDLEFLSKETLSFPAVYSSTFGFLLKQDASTAQRAMLKCLQEFLVRVPTSWNLIPIGTEAEMELLNWDAEKYRQKLSKTSHDA